MIECSVAALALMGSFAAHVAIDPSLRTDLMQRYIKPAGFYVKLPAAPVIKERLCAANFGTLVEKTKIDEQLANKELYYRDVESKIRYHLCWHGVGRIAYSPKTPASEIMADKTRNQQVTEIMLQDYPALIEKIRAEKAAKDRARTVAVEQIAKQLNTAVTK